MIRPLIIGIVVFCTLVDLFSEENFITFSDYNWRITDAPAGKAPGPNIFLAENVSLDGRGRLVLRIRPEEEGWSCAELRLTEPLGYGVYEIEVESDPAGLDPQAVFGFFTYDYTAPPLYRELDIEFARWGDPAHPGGNQTVQPYTVEENGSRFPLDALGSRSLHRITWGPDEVVFSAVALSRGGWEHEVAGFTWSEGEVFDPGEALLHLNFWLFRGKAPRSGDSQLIRISAFRFRPLER
jgi:hypothetical protein